MTSSLGRLLVAQIALLKVRFLIRTIGFRRTLTLLSAMPVIKRPMVAPDPRWASEIRHVSRPPLGGSCLDRSVLLWFVCRQHRLDTDLRIGVQREDDTIVGHAWIEYAGAIINDDESFAAQFAAFDDDPVNMVFR